MTVLIFFLFFLGFASRKREEENKRREAEQQKGRLSPDPCRPHAPPSTHTEPRRQSGGPSKQPPASNTAQGPEQRASRGSPGRRSPSRALQKEQHLSPDLQRREPRKPNGKCVAFVISCQTLDCRLFGLVYLDHLHLIN